MSFYLTLIAAAIPVLLYYYFTRTFSYWKKRNVKHPKPVPLFGNIMKSALNIRHYFKDIKEIYDQYPNEKLVGLYRMTTPCLLIRDLDIINQILIKDSDKFNDRGFAFSKEGLGTNLFHADGDTWKVLRNKFSPMFTSGKLRNMLHLMTDLGDKFADYVHKECLHQPEQEVRSIVERYFMANISACAFGLDLDIDSKDQIEQLQRLDKIMFAKTFFTELDMMFPGILLKTNLDLFPKKVTDFFNNIVKLINTQRNGKPTSRRDFMDLILEMKNEGELQSKKRADNDKVIQLEVSDSLISAQAFIFYSAGYETSTSSMACMLYLLAKHPEIQDKLHAEIEQILKKYNGEVTYDALNEMTYLKMVFSETLRMFAIADNIFRKASEDYPIPGTDVVVAKGQTVIVSGFGIHYDEKYYPNPEKFDPERFSLDKIRARHPCTSMAFGIGPRNCIGE